MTACGAWVVFTIHDLSFQSHCWTRGSVAHTKAWHVEGALKRLACTETPAAAILKAAFDKLDFFQDGRLSCLEWQARSPAHACQVLIERSRGGSSAAALHRAARLSQVGRRTNIPRNPEKLSRFDPLKEPRRTCDSVLLRLFKAVDKDIWQHS